MEENITLVVKGLSINNYVATTSAGAPETDSPTQNTSTASSSTEGINNATSSNAIPGDMMKLLLQNQKVVCDISENLTSQNKKVLKELRDIKEAQEIGQRDMADFKKDRETDRQKYAQLQEQYMKLKQKNEDTTTRLKVLNREKCEIARKLSSLETDRNTLQQEVEMLKERQSSDAEKYLSKIQSREKEIEQQRIKISELEKMIASSNKTHKDDSVLIRDLKEQIETLQEKTEISEEIDDPNKHRISSTKGSSSFRHDIQLGEGLTVQSISSKETKYKTESPRHSSQLDMKMSRPRPKPFATPGAYNTPRQQAFVGTGPSTASHNIVHKKGQKFAPREYR